MNTKSTPFFKGFFPFLFLFAIDPDFKLSAKLKLTRPWTLTETKNHKLAFIAMWKANVKEIEHDPLGVKHPPADVFSSWITQFHNI